MEKLHCLCLHNGATPLRKDRVRHKPRNQGTQDSSLQTAGIIANGVRSRDMERAWGVGSVWRPSAESVKARPCGLGRVAEFRLQEPVLPARTQGQGRSDLFVCDQ